MKVIIKDVGYNRGYVIGPYLQERPGVNADVVLEDGEDQEECALKALRYLKSITDRFHKEENPHLYTEGLNGSDLPPHLKTEITFGNGTYSTPVIDYRKAEQLEAEIHDCITLEQLEQWVKDHPTFPGKLLSVINERRNALKTKE